MKKMLTLAVVATMASLVNAAAVESSNIVGYNTGTIVGGNYNMLSVPFQKVGTDGFSINTNLKVDGAMQSDDIGGADGIKIWNAATSSYEEYYLYTDGIWYNTISDESFETHHPNGLPAGTPFWYLAKGDVDFSYVVSGEVEGAAENDITLLKGAYNMVCNPYPVAFSINTDMILTNATRSEDIDGADGIMIWSVVSSSYEAYYLYTDGIWYNTISDESFETHHPNGLPAGTPFWYQAKPGAGSVTVTFAKP